MIRNVLSYFFLLTCFVTAHGQEVVKGLYSDPRIRKAWAAKEKLKSIQLADTLELPFFDDFSQVSIFPDSTRWMDNFVFINNTYSVKQRSFGIATFDALDNTGKLYPSASPFSFEADHLTSHPINLKYFPSDSVYLSFLYEPAGIGARPEVTDTLTLQFFAPAENKWHSVWKTDDIYADTFKAVNIRITDPKYLLKGFQFRFINYASLSTYTSDPSMMGNVDLWNLDYIRLDKSRNSADTVFHDVAFTTPVRSVLKNYESMPWKHFRQFFLSEMGPYVTVNYFNNDTIVRNVTRLFEIWDQYRNILANSFSGGAANISPLSAITYQGPLIYTFNTTSTDSALFRIKSFLTTDLFDYKKNDTIIYYQKFGNEYSYDDGSAEAGYGINGLGSDNAMVACRYTVLAPDTLRAVKICFNESYQDANFKTFNIAVFSDAGGLPGNLIASETGVSVLQGPGMNGFRTYYLTIPVEVSGTYYVGWQQTSEVFLNAGLDFNTPNKGRQYYYLNGTWNQSQVTGTLMIRPVFGPRQNATGIADILEDSEKFKFWPNPAGDYISVDKSEQNFLYDPVVVITDLQGRELIRTRSIDKIDLSSLSPGMYIIIRYNDGRRTGFGRLVKSK